jgi:hypothetical protein
MTVSVGSKWKNKQLQKQISCGSEKTPNDLLDGGTGLVAWCTDLQEYEQSDENSQYPGECETSENGRRAACLHVSVDVPAIEHESSARDGQRQHQAGKPAQ